MRLARTRFLEDAYTRYNRHNACITEMRTAVVSWPIRCHPGSACSIIDPRTPRSSAANSRRETHDDPRRPVKEFDAMSLITALLCQTLLALNSAGDIEPEHTENSIYVEGRMAGLKSEGAVAKLPPPLLVDGMSKEEQRVALLKLAESTKALEDFLKPDDCCAIQKQDPRLARDDGNNPGIRHLVRRSRQA